MCIQKRGYKGIHCVCIFTFLVLLPLLLDAGDSGNRDQKKRKRQGEVEINRNAAPERGRQKEREHRHDGRSKHDDVKGIRQSHSKDPVSDKNGAKPAKGIREGRSKDPIRDKNGAKPEGDRRIATKGTRVGSKSPDRNKNGVGTRDGHSKNRNKNPENDKNSTKNEGDRRMVAKETHEDRSKNRSKNRSKGPDSNKNGTKPEDNGGEHLTRLLDEAERRVDLLRDTAARLEREKEAILESIKKIKMSSSALLKLSAVDREDLLLNTDRVLDLCNAVSVRVDTPRDASQIQALEQVNQVIKSAVDRMQKDPVNAKAKIRGFWNACSPYETTGYIDQKFQSLVLGCTIDDQKKIRHQLAQLIEEI